MLEFERDGLSGNVGVRLVETKVYSLAYQNLNAPGANGTAVVCPNLLSVCTAAPNAIVSSRLGVYLPQEVTTKHTDTLPSFNLRYDITSELVGRAAVSRTLGRPNYNELAGNTTLDNLRLTGSSGNPRLRPITATNFDLNLAWYFKPRAYFSVGMFTQDLKDYVKVGTSDVVFFNTQTQTNAVYTVQSRIGVSAKVSGIETSLEYPIGNGFGVGANGTVIEGKDKDGVELLGTSNVTYNVTGWFENDNFSARLAWNYRSDYAIGFTGDGTYNVPAPGGVPNGIHKYKSEGSLDLSMSYKITKNFSVTFDGTNLLNPVRSTYYKNASGLDNAPGYWHESGRQFFVNLRAQF
jgi:iron complex outermembrane recepter protein